VKKFKTEIAFFEESNVYGAHFHVPTKVKDYFEKKKIKRFICRVGAESWHCAIMSKGKDYNFVLLNKARIKRMKWREGESFELSLEEDVSKYGMEMPEELSAIFEMDVDAEKHFHGLTAGKQRSLIYMVSKLKSEQKRIEKALVITEYLKRVQGALDYKELNEAFKEYKG